MLCQPLDKNANSSSRCSFDPIWNANDLSDAQYEKHDCIRFQHLLE
jgi:hypothetical protein